MDQQAQITNSKVAWEFLHGGRAHFTLRSRSSGTRYTYRVSRFRQSDRYFASTLYGGDNGKDYAYIGLVTDRGLVETKNSKLSCEDPRIGALAWALKQIIHRPEIPENLEFWHEGRCAACGRRLTVPESIASGFGPECSRKKMRPAKAA